MTPEQNEVGMLIELDLYDRVRLIKLGKFPDETERIEKAIQSFENKLQENYRKIPNLHEFIIAELNRVEKAKQELNKMRQQEEER